MLLPLPAAKLLFYVKHFELFCTWNVQINLTNVFNKKKINWSLKLLNIYVWISHNKPVSSRFCCKHALISKSKCLQPNIQKSSDVVVSYSVINHSFIHNRTSKTSNCNVLWLMAEPLNGDRDVYLQIFSKWAETDMLRCWFSWDMERKGLSIHPLSTASPGVRSLFQTWTQTKSDPKIQTGNGGTTG